VRKTAVITGSSSGIGMAIAKELSLEKMNIVINYNQGKDKALKLLDEVRKNDCMAIAVKADVSNFSEANKLIEKTVEQFGKVDILVNNAGISSQKLFTEILPEDLNRIFKVNVYSMFYCTQAAVKDMIKRHYGKIINISSIWGITGASCEAHYSSTKAAVIGLTKSLAKELGPSNINVNCVAPGVIKTPMNDFLNSEEVNSILEITPLGRLGNASEIAKLVKFLSSSDSDFITGQIISPNGGILI